MRELGPVEDRYGHYRVFIENALQSAGADSGHLIPQVNLHPIGR